MTVFEGFLLPEQAAFGSCSLQFSSCSLRVPNFWSVINPDGYEYADFFFFILFYFNFFSQASREQRYHDGKCPENDRSKPQAEAAAESSGHGALRASTP